MLLVYKGLGDRPHKNNVVLETRKIFRKIPTAPVRVIPAAALPLAVQTGYDDKKRPDA